MNTENLKNKIKKHFEDSFERRKEVGACLSQPTPIEEFEPVSIEMQVYVGKTLNPLSMIEKCNVVWYWDKGVVRIMQYVLPDIEKKRFSDMRKLSNTEFSNELDNGFNMIDSLAIKNRKVYLRQII